MFTIDKKELLRSVTELERFGLPPKMVTALIEKLGVSSFRELAKITDEQIKNAPDLGEEGLEKLRGSIKGFLESFKPTRSEP
jgi:hypothetical protein